MVILARARRLAELEELNTNGLDTDSLIDWVS